MKKLFLIGVMVLAILAVIGYAGSYEHDLISCREFIIKSGSALLCCLACSCGLNYLAKRDTD